MSVDLAPVIRKGFRPHWATTAATTKDNELPDISVASEVALGPERVFLVAVVPYARTMFGALPPSAGRALLFEGDLEQVGHVEDAIASSSLVPHFPTASAWGSPVASSDYCALLPSAFHRDEVLNWDAAIEVAPGRPSGTLAVTLEYAGRSTPTPVEDPWD